MSLIQKIPLRPNRDDRGFVWFPVQDVPELEGKVPQNLHCAELRSDVIRGGHYHPRHTEYALLTGTHILLVVENASGEREEHLYESSPDLLIIIPPSIRHWISNAGDSSNYYFGFFLGDGDVETVRLDPKS